MRTPRLVLALLCAATLSAPLVPADPAAASGTSLAGAVPAVEAFVAHTRGLAFLRPVAVQALDDAAFTRAVLAGSSRPRAPHDTGATYQALHLVPSAGRYDDREARTTATGVVGFYLPGENRLVVRAGAPTPFARSVLAHELTHALQDQHFGLASLQRRGTDADRAQAVAALYEGDAVRVEDAYVAAMTPADRRSHDRAVASYGGDSSPESRIVGAVVGFPYAYGPDLVAALLRAGGQPRLDRAFRDPPQSTEQVVDPARLPVGAGRRDRPLTVARPAVPRGARVVDSGVLGAFGLAVLLAVRVPDVGVRSRAALGWGGDAFVTWRVAQGWCTRVHVVLDTDTDRAELLGALRTFAAGYPRTDVAATGRRDLLLTSCR